MNSDITGRIPVHPTRVGDLGIGSFLVLVGGASVVLCCVGSSLMQQPARNRFQAISIITYGALITFLTNAERRSRWEPQNDIISDIDNMWLPRIIVGVLLGIGSSLGLFKVFQLDLCGSVVAKEIVSEHHVGGKWRKFLF